MLLKDRKIQHMEGTTPQTTGSRPGIGAAPRTNLVGWIVAALVIVAVTVAIFVMTMGDAGEEGASETATAGSTETTEPLFTPEELRQMELIEELRFGNQFGNQVP
jgi:hypothetical protein